MLYASYIIPTASNNKIVTMITICLNVRSIGQHGGVEKKAPIRFPRPMGVQTSGQAGEHHAHHTGSPMQTRCQQKSEASDSATKLLARLPLKKSGFEIVLMIKLAGLTNGRAILRSSIFL